MENYFSGIPKHRRLFILEPDSYMRAKSDKNKVQICKTVYFHWDCSRYSLNNEQQAAHCH